MSEQGAPKLKHGAGPGDIPALELTPVFANKSNATMNAVTTRLAFGEFVVGNQDTDVNYHTVITMPTVDAVSLAQLILALYQTNPGAQEMTKALQRIATLPAMAGQTAPPKRN